MKQELTVDKAIKRGHLTVNVPVWSIMLGTPGISMYLFSLKLIPNWGIAVSFFIGFLLAWLFWSYRVTKWRLWAFENVRNVHELKKRAIQEGLIWKDNKWYNKTEIKSSFDKLKWKELEKKFEKEDEYREDHSLPKSSIIYYSKSKNAYELIIMLGCLGLGILLLVKSDSYITGTLLSIAGAYFSFKEFRQVTNSSPQIIIDDKGIKTITTDFQKWSEIKNEEVIMERTGKQREFYLIYDYPNGLVKLKIDDYNINQKELENLLRTYRIRNNKNAPN